MECPSINNVQFDERSKQGIEHIRNLDVLADLLAGAIGAGVMVTIFARSGPLQSSYNITTTEWETFAQAVRGIPDMKRNRIEMEAAQQVWAHEHDYKQKQFWMAIYHGCQVE